MHGPLIQVLQAEWRSKFEGPVPPPHELVWHDWVGPFLRLLTGTRTNEASDPRPLQGEERTSHAV